jgi:hypothetical protein
MSHEADYVRTHDKRLLLRSTRELEEIREMERRMKARSPASDPVRASDAEREDVIGRLRVAELEGRLSADELEERVGAALVAKTRGEVAKLLKDLPEAPAVAPPVQKPRPVRRPVRSKRESGWAETIKFVFVFWIWWLVIFLVMFDPTIIRSIAQRIALVF